MLSPREISNKRFEKSAFGYRADDVDSFLNSIAEEYSKILNERNEFEAQLNKLSDTVEKYKQEESSLSSILIGAQKLGDSIIREAKGKAELIIQDAGIKSDKMLEGTHVRLEQEKREYSRLQEEVASFKSKIVAMYKTHLELVSALPGSTTNDENKINKPKNEKNSYIEQNNSDEDTDDSVKEEYEGENLDQVADEIVVGTKSKAKPSAENNSNKQDYEDYDEEDTQEEYEYQNPKARQNPKRVFLPDLDEPKDVPNINFSFDENYTNYSVPYGATEVIDSDSYTSPKFGELRFGEGYDLAREDEQNKKKKKRR